ncbi:biotin--[acetyl-CoA-carboxylase] ligase family protein [Brucepastera parasyntrophica]|uniref:biotin--[acetyl-CoA-carboxylase] ligase n=1 Tax=Brucepastera parasyntrophica TaxID=2880008 RepID=UPI00210A0BC4|nr:biotin--[acetyl-CoA-carboxylase] ligase [Brucepastera parasyntrophica]ULQ59437.1 biotin--[acetyl-CoA-carboxylase] ligase family protein [Brucepastera parasyntrophica]
MAYIRKSVANSFNAPVYFIPETDSTMRDARILAGDGEPDGTVVYAGIQNNGRGRIPGRLWETEAGKNLLCTVLLRRPPAAGFTLRVGLAVARTFDSFLPGPVKTEIKWPNDVLYENKKLSGILCENDTSVTYAGTGFNIGQTAFPPHLRNKAFSLELIYAALSAPPALPSPRIFWPAICPIWKQYCPLIHGTRLLLKNYGAG